MKHIALFFFLLCVILYARLSYVFDKYRAVFSNSYYTNRDNNYIQFDRISMSSFKGVVMIFFY
jgi:hypothetical protein